MKRLHRILWGGLLAALMLAPAAAVAAQELSASEIVKKAKHMAYYQGKDGNARVKMTITDKQGRVVGSLTTGTAEDAALDANAAKNQIPGASYTTRQAWRDPSCVETAPPADAGTNQIILPGSADDYKIEVLDASGKPTSIAIHTYDKQGKSSVQTIDNPGSAVAQLSVTQALWRGRIESGLRVAAPFLDLLLVAGDRLSQAVAPADDTQDLDPGAPTGARKKARISGEPWPIG